MATTGTAFNAVTKAVSGEVYKKRNASCILGVTSASNTGNVSEILTVQNSAYRGGQKNGYPIVSTTFGKVKALSTGTFAYQVANKWIMLGGNVSQTISGVSNTTLANTGGDYRRRAIPYKLTARTAFLSGLSWSADELEGPTYTMTVSASNPSFGNDTGAMLTRTSRGSVFFMITGKLATEVSWPSLNLW